MIVPAQSFRVRDEIWKRKGHGIAFGGAEALAISIDDQGEIDSAVAP